MNEIKSEFFYSKSTGLYVSRKPLKIDSRVKKAAEKNNIKISWNDEGRINFIDFDTAKKLIKSLGSLIPSPVEYWLVLRDAKEANDADMVAELMSNKYCEWLDRVYLREGTFIDHPQVLENFKYTGRKQKTVTPYGKPGWFNPENNIDYKLGLPKKVETFREKFATSWKYWFPNFTISYLKALAPIRGYVTSVGKPSFDLGIPVDSKQPMQMIRECRRKPLEPPIDEKIIDEAYGLLEDYNQLSKNMPSLMNRKYYDAIYKRFNVYIGFLEKNGKFFRKSKELTIYKIREQLINLLGLMKAMALSKNDMKKVERIDRTSNILLNINGRKLDYNDFLSFVRESRKRLEGALKDRKDIVFVMGHKNPDTDTVVSSIFEAWRNNILDSGNIAYMTIIQNYKIPGEAAYLLGKTSHDVLLNKEKLYFDAINSGLSRWISTDQNREPDFQKYFISIIDHHVVCDIAKQQDLPKTLEMVGSCTSLIVQKILGMGLYFDKELARILYGATLMDTENRVAHKMTIKDEVIMDYLKNISGISDDNEFYRELMSFLLDTDDPNVLFGRDYKEDWGFGFAVAKVKNCFDENGNVLKEELIKKTLELAKENNINKNLPLTVLRITDYKDDNETVKRERVYFVFNKNTSEEFKTKTFETMEKIIRFEFKGTRLRRTKTFIDFWGTGLQLSRKKTAPTLEPVVKAFNEYFYSPSLRLWVKRDFLKKTNDLIGVAIRLKMKVSTDEEKRINYITYPEARMLIEKLHFIMLSLREYWITLDHAKKIKDIQMIKSLQGSNFVEFLDSIIKNYEIMIEHPKIKKIKDSYGFEGREIKVNVPKGSPGLIHPDDIDIKTGIPKVVRNPNEYGNPVLWRYWEPDLELVTPTRSYIFLLNQPCWDGKVHITDSLPNLGIRPCTKTIKLPKVRIILTTKRLSILIKSEGDSVKYSWTR